jgi:hypothetical protein
VSKDVQQFGLAYEDLESYIGEDRQLVIDTTNHRITLHDGVTPGGYIFPHRDELDTRYQAKIPDLDAFATFEPMDRGPLVRLGPASYQFRSIEGDSESVTVDNPLGQDGDFIIRLLSVIEKDLTFSGLVQFTTVIQAVGLIGDTQGTHFGDVNGNVTGNITGDSTGTHHGPAIGAIDARGQAVQFDDNQIPQAKITGLVSTLAGMATVPTGMIAIWSGTVATIPVGWHLCDGGGGTPDLRDIFVMGGGGAHNPGITGGNTTYTPGGTIAANGAHTHTGSVGGHALTVGELPAHNHDNGITDDESGFIFNHGSLPAAPTTTKNVTTNPGTGLYVGVTSDTGSGAAHSHTLTIDSAGNHTHTFAGTAVDIIPPFYALAYIMKV